MNKKEERSAQSYGRIMAGALTLFVRNGYASTTVDSIAEAAGLTKGAVYFHLKTKENVMLKLLDEVEAIAVDRIVEKIEAAESDPRETVGVFIRAQAKLGVSNPQHMLLLILSSLEFDGTGGPIEERVRQIYRRLYTLVEEVIRKGQAAGTVRRDIGCRELAAVVMAGHDGVFLEWYRRSQELDGRELTRALQSTMTRGVGAR